MVKKGCLWGTIAGFVVSMAVLALPLAFIATLSAPLHTPQLIEQVICPAGSKVEVTWYQASWNKPGESTARVECVDAAGNRSPAAELDEKNFPSAMLIYYPICLLPLLLVGAVFGLGLFLLIRKMRQRDQTPVSYNS